MKEYRVDTFGRIHDRQFFNAEREAIAYAETEKKKGKITYLLKRIYDDTYDVVKAI